MLDIFLFRENTPHGAWEGHHPQEKKMIGRIHTPASSSPRKFFTSPNDKFFLHNRMLGKNYVREFTRTAFFTQIIKFFFREETACDARCT